MVEPDGAWLRPCTKLERLFDVTNKDGYMLTCYHMTINTQDPVTEEQFRETFKRLYRRVPTMRVCFRIPENDDELWVKEMEEPTMDFEFIRNGLVNEEVDKVIHASYNSHDGPLWRARVVISPENINDPCPEPDFEDEYPELYHVLIGMHHGVTDGYSMIKICSKFIDLLNDVIIDRVSDEEQLGVYSYGEKTELMMMEASDHLNDNQELLYEITNRIRAPHTPLLAKLAPKYSPKEEEIKTMSISHRFEADATDEFRQKCKEENVTVNSGFAAAVNASLILLAKEYVKKKIVDNSVFCENEEEKSKEGEEPSDEKIFNIKSEHFINVRRFWDDTPVHQLGCHITLGTLPVNTSTDVMLDFWDYAKQVHKQFQGMVKDRMPLLNEAALWLSQPEGSSIEEFLSEFKIPTCSYRLTNVGEVTSAFPEHDGPAQLSYISRSTSIHGLNTVSLHGINTFRERLSYVMDFSTKYIPLELAEKLMSKVVAMVETWVA